MKRISGNLEEGLKFVLPHYRTIALFTALLLCWAAALLMALPAWASTVDLPHTGQTTCYDSSGNVIACANTGQDGDIQAGVAWPDPRLTDNGDQTVTDNLTGLIWTNDAGTPTVGSCTGGTMNWQAALDYVACLNTNNYLGHNDWRLPNINEIESLVDASRYSPALPDGHPFTNVQENYWSSSTHANITDIAWYVNMYNPFMSNAYKSDFIYVWPVRAVSTSPAQLWKTGQTTSYATGDDGDLEMGVAWPDPRFTDNGDQTVTDNLTGLIWTNDAGTPTVGSCTGVTMNWQAALDYVACLNTNNYLGHNDWRLPNINEIESLVDASRYNPALPDGHPFTNVLSYFYWSSSTYALWTNHAWYVNMDYRQAGNSLKSSDFFVWPVRTGQAGSFYNLNISKNGTGSGTVTSSPSGIDCGSDCSESYNSGTSVTLTATPDTGSTFTGWSGDADCSDGQVTMNANKTCTATFTLLIPNISASPTSLNFGSVNVGVTSASQAVTVTNVGTANLSISAAALTGTNASEFIKQVDTCSGNTLPPSESCNVQIAFMPASTGAKTGTLSITSDDPDTPTLDVQLSGTGVQTSQTPQEEFELILSCPTNVTAGNALTVTVKLYNYDCTNSITVNRLMTRLMGNSSGTLFGLGIWGPYNKWITAKTVSVATCDEFGNVTTPGTVLPFSITIINPVPTSLSGKISEVTVDAITSKGESIGSGSCMINVQ